MNDKKLTTRKANLINRYNNLQHKANEAKRQLIAMLEDCELGEHPAIDHHIINTELREITREQWEQMS